MSKVGYVFYAILVVLVTTIINASDGHGSGARSWGSGGSGWSSGGGHK